VLSKTGPAGICALVLCGLCFGQGRPPIRSRGAASGRGTIPASNNTKGVYATSRGVVKSISKALLTVSVDEDHEIKFRLTRKTKFFLQDKEGAHDIKSSALESGQTVSVDAETALDGSFEAARVVVEMSSPKIW
jgi:hypothetical protein